MSKEVRLGILVTITILASIWGYNYIKGKNLFSSSTIYKVRYYSVGGLETSAPVYMNGVKVGRVSDVQLEPGNPKPVIVSIDILWEGLRISKDASANIQSSFMGSVNIHIKSNKNCEGDDCAEANSFLQGKLLGTLESAIGKDLDSYIPNLKNEVGSILDSAKTSILGDGENIDLDETIEELKSTIKNLNRLTSALANSSGTIQKSLSNVASITDNLKNQNADIDQIMSDMAAFTANLKSADINKITNETSGLIATADKTVGSLDQTLGNLNAQIAQIAPVISQLKNGEGTLGKLLNDEELYTNLNKLTVNTELLVKDLRLNPKRYAHFSLFGKKQKDYNHPKDDPSNTYINENDGN